MAVQSIWRKDAQQKMFYVACKFDETLKPKAFEFKSQVIKAIIKAYTSFPSHQKLWESSDYRQWHSTQTIWFHIRGS